MERRKERKKEDSLVYSAGGCDGGAGGGLDFCLFGFGAGRAFCVMRCMDIVPSTE